MTNDIHPSATVPASVRMGKGNRVGPGCVLAEGVVLGNNNTLWMNVYLGPGTVVGDENAFHMGAVAGHEPQDLAFEGKPSGTRIGDRNVIREYVTIHRGTQPGSETRIGNRNFLMANAHVAHNCVLGDEIIMVNFAALTGHCEVADKAFISGMVGFHQFSRVGRLAMVSALSAINKDIPPFMLVGGRPGVVQGINVVGLRRAGLDAGARTAIKEAYRLLYRSGLNVTHALEQIEQTIQAPEAREIVDFVRKSARGICAGADSEAEADTIRARKT